MREKMNTLKRTDPQGYLLYKLVRFSSKGVSSVFSFLQ